MYAIKTDSLLRARLWAKKSGRWKCTGQAGKLEISYSQLSVLTVDLSLLPQQHPEVMATRQGVRV